MVSYAILEEARAVGLNEEEVIYYLQFQDIY